MTPELIVGLQYVK